LRKRSVVFELTDGEIRAFWFSVFPFKKQGHSSVAVKFDCIPIPTGVIEQGNVRDEKVLLELLLTYSAQNLGKNHKAYLAIPLQQGFIRSYTLPWIPKRDRKSAISLLVDEEISITRSDLLFDFLVLSEEKHKGIEILLGATRQSLIDQYVHIFGRAGFKVTGVDFAFSILGQSLGFGPNEDVLYLQGKSDTFQIALFRGAVPESVRSLNERVEAWEDEIRRFLLYYRTQHPDLNLKRLVWNGDSVAESMAQGLLTSNHVSEVEQATLTDIPDSWRQVLEENRGLSEVVVGYGSRISAHHPELNLWRQPNITQTVLRRYRGIAAFAVALLLIVIISGLSLHQMALPLQQDVQQISIQGARLEAKVKQQEAFETAWNKVKMNPERVGDGIAQIQAINGLPGQKLIIEQVTYKQGTMSLRGSTMEASNVQTLMNELRTMGWEQPTLSSYKLTSPNTVEFSLSAKRGRSGAESQTTTALGEGG